MSVQFKNLLRLFNRTTDPASPSAGDIWWRSNESQLHASDGLSGQPITVGPTGNVHSVGGSQWHAIPKYGATSTVSVLNGRAYALPLWPSSSTTITSIAVNVTTALALGVVRIGIYESDGTHPTSLLADYGTLAVTIPNGIKQLSSISTPLRPVLYFLVIVRQTGGGGLVLGSRDTGSPYVHDASPVLDLNRNAYYVDGVAGALPASFGVPAGTTEGPSATLQLA